MEFSRRNLDIMKKTLFEKGYLDDQFHQLEELADDVNPNFVEEVVVLFFKDSTRLLDNIDKTLLKTPHDFSRLDAYMYQFIGSCSSIGAVKVKQECFMFREYCKNGNIEGCRRTFQKAKKELSIVRQKLETYFQLLRQIGPMEKGVQSY